MFNIDKTNNSVNVNAADAEAKLNNIFSGQVGGAGRVSELGTEVFAAESFSTQSAVTRSPSNRDALSTINEAIAALETSPYMLGLAATPDEQGVLTTAQKNAIAIVSMATTNSKGFQSALKGSSRIVGNGDDNVTTVSSDVSAYSAAATFADAEVITAGESFESVELTGTHGLNIIAAARQAKLSPFSEMFAPTVAVPPSKQSVALTVRVPLIQRAAKHALNGNGIELNRRSVVEARYDSSILQNDITTIQAVYRDTGDENSTVDKLAPAAEIAPELINHNGVECKVQPIRCGIDVDLMGLNSTTGLNGIQEDDTSQIAPSPRIGKIYIRLEKAGVVEVIPVDVRDMPMFQFNRAANQSNDKLGMSLNVETSKIPLASQTADGKVTYLCADRSPSKILESLATAGVAMNLRLNASGNTNLETGKTLLAAAIVKVADGLTRDGTVIPASSTTFTDAFAGVEMTMAYWYPAMSMTNSNWMREGLNVNYNEYSFPYAIPTLSPFTLKEPVDEASIAQSVSDLAGVVTQQADNNVALAVLAYAEIVERAAMAYTGFSDETGVLGAGSVLMSRPYHNRVKIDCIADINSTETSDKREDFQALFLDVLRHEIAEADRGAGLQGAVDSLTSNSGKKVKAHIGCDPILRQHLFQSGEPRTAGNYEFQIESTELKDWAGKCVIMLGLEGSAGENPLCTGQRWFTPDQLRTATISGNSTTKHTMIIPHYSIVFNTPAVIEIEVTNLDVLFTKATYTTAHVANVDGTKLETKPEAVAQP